MGYQPWQKCKHNWFLLSNSRWCWFQNPKYNKRLGGTNEGERDLREEKRSGTIGNFFT